MIVKNMVGFEKIKAEFGANWTTVLVAWTGLGVLSPWPDRWKDFPPLIAIAEIKDFAGAMLSQCSDPIELDLILALTESDLGAKTREEVVHMLEPLAGSDSDRKDIELRKWRWVLLDEVLMNLPENPEDGLMALTEFWQEFGFPADSPHVVQGRGNAIGPSEYYTKWNLKESVNCHRAWMEKERVVLRQACRA